MAFKPEVQTDATGKWHDNSLRFATIEEAEASARDLSYRWTAVLDWRAVEAPEPVNYRYESGTLVAIDA